MVADPFCVVRSALRADAPAEQLRRLLRTTDNGQREERKLSVLRCPLDPNRHLRTHNGQRTTDNTRRRAWQRGRCPERSRRAPFCGMSTVDFVVIGAGIAGASVAYELAAAAHGSANAASAGMRSGAAAAHGSANAASAGMRSGAAARGRANAAGRSCRVVLLEREPHSGYHSTGRSAALFSEIYGNAVVRALSRASRSFLLEPPAGFADGSLLEPRGVLYIATSEQHALIEEFRSEPDIQRDTREISTTEALERVPILRQEKAAYCALEPDAMDVEANALHQGFLKGLRARGGKIMTNCAIESVSRLGGDWSIVTSAETFTAPVLINAARRLGRRGCSARRRPADRSATETSHCVARAAAGRACDRALADGDGHGGDVLLQTRRRQTLAVARR